MALPPHRGNMFALPGDPEPGLFECPNGIKMIHACQFGHGYTSTLHAYEPAELLRERDGRPQVLGPFPEVGEHLRRKLDRFPVLLQPG